MNRSSSATAFCSIERTRSRTRIVIRHDPAFVVGLIAHRRKGRFNRFGGLTRKIAQGFNEARKQAGGLLMHPSPFWGRGQGEGG